MKTNIGACILFCFFVSLSFSVSAQYPSQGLIAHYRMDGNANDNSGNNLHGTASGNIAGMTDRHGVANGALYFDGTDDYIRVTRHALLEPNVVTVCAWVKPEVTPTYHYNTIITKRMHHADDPYNSYMLDAGGTATQNKYFFSASNGTAFGSQHELDGTYDWTASTDWDFVVGVFDGQEMKLYINGTLNASFAYTGNLGYTSYDLFIGTPSFPLQFLYKGGMDDVAIFDRALSATEIANIYEQVTSVKAPVGETPVTTLYPNPAGAEIRVELNGGEMPTGMQIIDSKGAVILNEPFSERIDLKNVGGGLYYLRLTYSDGRHGTSMRFVRTGS